MNPCGSIWEGFVGSRALLEDEVHVWRAGLNSLPSGLVKLRTKPFPDERERAKRSTSERTDLAAV